MHLQDFLFCCIFAATFSDNREQVDHANSDTSIRFRDDSDLSPRARMSVTEDPFNRARFDITPWEEEGGHSTHTSTQKPVIRPGKARSPGGFLENAAPPLVGPKFGGYLHQPSEERSPRSPSFPSLLGRHDTWNVDFAGADRRPSVASTMTMSSTGSGPMPPPGRMVHKKLHGFFGDHPPLREGRFGSDASSASNPGAEGGRPGYSRSASIKDGFMSGQATPDAGMRAKTPPMVAPAAEVTPWEFQDPQVSRR